MIFFSFRKLYFYFMIGKWSLSIFGRFTRQIWSVSTDLSTRSLVSPPEFEIWFSDKVTKGWVFLALVLHCLYVTSLLFTQGSMETTMASFNIGSHDSSGAGVNLRSTGLLGKIFRSQWLWWWQINKKTSQVMLQISMIHLEYFIFMNTTFGYFILSLLSCQVLYLVYVYYFL